MKNYSVFLLSILMIFSFLAGDELKSENQALGKYGRVLNELKLRLALDEVQFKKSNEVFFANESQKKVDLDLFKTSSMAMIRAAERRREITDSRINEILSDLQKISFEKYKKEREADKELFRLREGVLLTNKQEIQAEIIISEYENVLKRLYIRLDYYIKSGQDRKKKSSESGKLLKSRTGGLERRNPEVVKMEQGPPEKILEVQNEKAKRIKEYLTGDQKVLYSELLKFQEQELRSYIRKLRR